MPEMTAMQKVDAALNVLDKLTDAQGRVKCGYIWAMSELMEGLKEDIRGMMVPAPQAQATPEIVADMADEIPQGEAGGDN